MALDPQAILDIHPPAPVNYQWMLDNAATVQVHQAEAQQAQQNMAAQQRLQQLAQQYGDDPDRLVTEMGREFPMQAQKLAEQIGKARTEGAQAHLKDLEVGKAQLTQGLSLLQGANADNWNDVGGQIAKMAPQLTPYLKRPYSDDLRDGLIRMGQSADQFVNTQQKAAELLVDGKQRESVATLYAGADTPQKRTVADGLVKQAGLGSLAQYFPDQQSAQAYVDAQQKQTEDKVQGAEIEAIKAWKREHPGQEPTQKDIDLIHRGFKEAGTVVRVDTGAGQAVADVKEAVKGMVEGTIPPQLPGRASKEFTALMAESHRQGFNLVKANEDWQATQKYLGTLNGNQQTTLRQSVDMVEGSVPVVRSLIKQWDSSGLPVLSAATLKAAQAGAFGASQQSLANRLEGQIADMTSALGTVYKGGNSSTDQSLALAAKNLQGSWSKQAALDALDQIGVNINIRKHSLRLPPVTNEGNVYAPTLGAAPPPTPTVNPKDPLGILK